jgi:hypothetical protein
MAIFPTPAPCPCSYRGVYEGGAKSFPHASAAARLLTFRIVERLQPVASWILDQLIPRSGLGLVGQGSLSAAEFGWIVVGVVAPTRRGDVGVVA